jgi:hypothetical protein
MHGGEHRAFLHGLEDILTLFESEVECELAMATIPLLAPLCGVPKKTRPVLEQS